jgi:hypothetical protein
MGVVLIGLVTYGLVQVRTARHVQVVLPTPQVAARSRGHRGGRACPRGGHVAPRPEVDLGPHVPASGP